MDVCISEPFIEIKSKNTNEYLCPNCLNGKISYYVFVRVGRKRMRKGGVGLRGYISLYIYTGSSQYLKIIV